MAKKDFNEKFNEICNKEKQKKAKKQQKFNENIQPYLVYMDDDGNIYTKESKKNTEDLKELYIAKTVKSKKNGLSSSDIIILLIVILNLVYFLYCWFNYLGIL